jgi:hypothetical protein
VLTAHHENAGTFAKSFGFFLPIGDGLGANGFSLCVKIFCDAKQHIARQIFTKELK